ncbi:MAG TPA: 6-pyruvoyl-tetrahydropterin synthase-related protein [Candidatus Bathyarchaeia archaeon]|nr:6-pyruvoyl-tetrahydropterin synthase-related protein [Candidatus Bathyarchaeia archaeon]
MTPNIIGGKRAVSERWLDRYAWHALVFAVAISCIITLPRFAPGIPMGIDTTSHLYRVLFLSEWLRRGVFPFWSPDWYGGSPTLLLYPPLGYFFSVGLSMLGVDPLLSYKIVDAVFYCLAPLTLYSLAREFGFSKGESAFASALYSVVPEVIENYLFYDRFPTVVAIPIFCAFIIMFHRALMGSRRLFDLLMSILLMSALLLTHHLSALIAGIVALLIIVVERGKIDMSRSIPDLVAIGFGTLCLSAFWFVPFAESLRLFSGNNFYNRNVIFPFITISYFGINVVVYLLGIVQFSIALFAIHPILKEIYTNHLHFQPSYFVILLLVGMGLYETGISLASILLTYFGQSVVILSFVCFLGQFLFVEQTKQMSEKNRVLVIVFWFIIFLWIGLGYYALPLIWLPYVREAWIRTMDVYRIWLYLALPMSALASFGLKKLFSKAPSKLISVGLVILLATPIAAGVLLKVNYASTAPVNGVLPYTTSNAEIPQPILDYFRHDSSSGRILGINVPFWIYVLPNYVDKPILDGWYPQTKLLTPLVNVNDYRIDDLETTPNLTSRLVIWRGLIAQADLLDITWVMVGGWALADQLMIAGRFVEQLSVLCPTAQGFIDLILFKIVRAPSFVVMSSSDFGVQNVSQPNPDEIVLTFSDSARSSEVLVKEAYFPTWQAMDGNHVIQVERENSTGYILLTIPAGVTEVILYQNRNKEAWSTLSIIALFICCIGLIVSLATGRRM